MNVEGLTERDIGRPVIVTFAAGLPTAKGVLNSWTVENIFVLVGKTKTMCQHANVQFLEEKSNEP